MQQPFIYIITDDRNTTLYIGVTSNLANYKNSAVAQQDKVIELIVADDSR